MASRIMLIRGGCHCGNIRFELDWVPDPAVIPARACGCSFCVKHGGVWTSCPGGSLAVTVSDPDRVRRYAFGTETADFHICTDCGIVPVISSRIDGDVYAVVSVNAFENVAPEMLDRSDADFEGEATDDRLRRRKRNWIADVRFSSSSA
jgi:hypothetical protein